MDLSEHIADPGRRADLARACNTSPDYLWQIATDRRKASHELAKKIEAATAGAVTRYDLRPDIFGEAPAEHAKAA